MNRRDKNFRRELRTLVALVLAAGASRAAAQSAYLDGMTVPDLTLPRLRYFKNDVEVEMNSYMPKSGGNGTDSTRIYLAPAAGIGWNYFLYHPALLTFEILAEPGYNWQQYSGTGLNSASDSVMLNGSFTGQLLREKDYAATIGYTRSHDDYHYDFYNSATVDTQTLNLNTGYRAGAIPFTFDFNRSDSDTEGLTQSTHSDQFGLQLHARNERKDRDATDLAYQFNQLNYDTNYKSASYSTENTYHLVTLTDTEHFKRSTLGTSVRYYDITSTTSASSDLNAALAFSLEHTPQLRSFYDYNFSRYEGNGAESYNHYLTAGVSHQLYESLSSGVNIHGSAVNSTFSGSKFDSQIIGLGESEDYSKRLGNWGRLSLGNSLNYDLNFQQADASQIFIADEAYTIPASGPLLIRLKTPRELSVSSVKKNNIDLAPGEYTLITSSDPWQIQFFTGGPNNLQPGDAVTVSYTAESNPSGNYSVFTDDAHLSLRFWNDRAEMYARYARVQNQSSSGEFVLQDVNEFEAGANVEWLGLRGAASYTDHRSTLYSYRSLNLSEGYSHPVSLHSTAGVELGQQWNMYPAGSGTVTNSAQTGTYFNFMAHYDWTPAANFNWHLEAGYQAQQGLGYDENLFAVRTYFNWTLGKLEVHLGYEHDHQAYTAETRARDFAFVRMRRNF